jgi:hypothetical protein
VGNISILLDEEYTSALGTLTNGVVPYAVLDKTLEEGDCVFLYPKDLFCDPACTSGTTCDETGNCVPYPRNISVGTLRLEGLSAPVSMDPIVPSLIYFFTGDLPHPGFNTGDRIELYASGVDDYAAFSMLAYGVSPLEVSQTEMALIADQPSSLSWTPSASEIEQRIRVQVSIANHGGIPARIECDTLDNGTLELPSSLVNALLNVGYSGFPSVKVTRQSSDTSITLDGCADFTVQSSVTLPVRIPGLVSCSSDDDCPEGQSCLSDLTCG